MHAHCIMIERDRLMQCSDGACTEARDRVPLQARRVNFDGDRVCGCVCSVRASYARGDVSVECAQHAHALHEIRWDMHVHVCRLGWYFAPVVGICRRRAQPPCHGSVDGAKQHRRLRHRAARRARVNTPPHFLNPCHVLFCRPVGPSVYTRLRVVRNVWPRPVGLERGCDCDA
jgi:hypothetical protein